MAKPRKLPPGVPYIPPKKRKATAKKAAAKQSKPTKYESISRSIASKPYNQQADKETAMRHGQGKGGMRMNREGELMGSSAMDAEGASANSLKNAMRTLDRYFGMRDTRNRYRKAYFGG